MLIAILYTNKNTTVLAKRQIRSRLWISRECKQEQLQVNTIKCMCSRVIITKVETDHHCGFYRDANNTHTKHLQIAHANKILTRSLFPSLLSCEIINLLATYLPIFISILTLKVFILPDLGGVTLVHCSTPAEAIRNHNSQKTRKKMDKAHNTFEVSEHKDFKPPKLNFVCNCVSQLVIETRKFCLLICLFAGYIYL